VSPLEVPNFGGMAFGEIQKALDHIV